MAGAVFGEFELSLFVAGAVFGEVELSLFLAGAVFGEVALSLFMAGAVFHEIWNAIVVFFNTKCSPRLRGGLRTDGFMVGSFSDRPRIVNDVSSVFTKFLSHFGRSFFVAGAVFGEVRP